MKIISLRRQMDLVKPFLPPLASLYEPLLDKGYLPDPLIRMGIRQLLAKRCSQLDKPMDSSSKMEYIRYLKSQALALNTKEANEQHYEVPTAFFQCCLGERMKYSCCLYDRKEPLWGNRGKELG